MTDINELKQMLEVVDENGEFLRLEERKKIHELGLLHKETHLWFVTPDRGIIFQHRAKDKDTFPDLLDATVGGHVEPGDSYLETAIKECEEEAGVRLTEKDIKYITTLHVNHFDDVTKMTNNVLRAQYVYLFTGIISDLKIEDGKSQGFVSVPYELVMDMPESEKKKFIPSYYEEDYRNVFKLAIEKLGLNN
jgi:isopentenyldiphosphate isomerase